MNEIEVNSTNLFINRLINTEHTIQSTSLSDISKIP